MQKIFLTLVSLIGLTSLSFAQKTIQDPNVEKRAVTSFHGIEVETGIELVLTQGNTEDVAVSASSAAYRDHIVTKVEDGILHLYYQSKLDAPNTRKQKKTLKAYVSYTQLDRLNVSTGAMVKVEGLLTCSSLDLNVNTGAMVRGQAAIGSLKIQQSTGSQVELTGKSDELRVEGSTGSKFRGEEMTTNNCVANVSTGAKISVNADKELDAKASTGGNIEYKGAASVKTIKTTSGGSVKKI